MATITIDIEVRCEQCNDLLDCHIGQEMQGDWSMTVEPCEYCIEQALDELAEILDSECQDARIDSYHEGHAEGTQEGWDDGYAEGLEDGKE